MTFNADMSLKLPEDRQRTRAPCICGARVLSGFPHVYVFPRVGILKDDPESVLIGKM